MKITKQQFKDLEQKVNESSEAMAKVYSVLGWDKTHWKADNLNDLVQKFREIISHCIDMCLEKDLPEGEETNCSTGGVCVFVSNYEGLPEIDICADISSIYATH